MQDPRQECPTAGTRGQEPLGGGSGNGYVPRHSPGAAAPPIPSPTTHTVSETPDIHAIIPLSLLEAMRNIDTPVDDGLNELAEEMVSKRLGLSATVAAQIERYRRAAVRDGSVGGDEGVSVFRLVGRRPDAALVFADAGRRAARYAARRAPSLTRALIRVTPGPLRRRLGFRAAQQVARHVLTADMQQRDGAAAVEMRESLATRAGAESGCYFYSHAFAELLRVLGGFEGAMAHGACRVRGDSACTWRATRAEGYE